jgi:hypothetical protein
MRLDREQTHNENSSRSASDGSVQWKGERGLFVIFMLAFFLVAFSGGAIITVAGIAPSNYFKNAYRAGTALYDKYTRYHDPLSTDLWAPTRTSQYGVSYYNRSKAKEGLTLYTSGHANKAFLIDMQGRIVYQWDRPYSTVWDKTAAVRHPSPDSRTNIYKAHLFPNGDLLAIYIGVGDTPYGYGMVRLDRQSQVIWKNLDHFHHDFAIMEDGRIYGLTHEFRFRPPEGVDHLDTPFLDDYLAIVSSQGRTLKKISLLDAFNRSDYKRLLWIVPAYSLADPLHANNVDLLDERLAAALRPKVPTAQAGQVLLSFRELAGGTLALLDIEMEKIVWAMRGSWLSQHDPDILPNGNILLFDNRGHYGQGGESRVIELDPANGGVLWEYIGRPDQPLNSMIRSDQQRLSNGNTLITESDGGRLLEIDSSSELVWEYINPARVGDRIAVLNWAERIDIEALQADFRDRLKENLVSLKEESTP